MEVDRYPADESVNGERGVCMQLLTKQLSDTTACAESAEQADRQEYMQILTAFAPRSDDIEGGGKSAAPK